MSTASLSFGASAYGPKSVGSSSLKMSGTAVRACESGGWKKYMAGLKVPEVLLTNL